MNSNNNNYPNTMQELQEELLEHAKDGRGGIGDAGFRLNIALAQMGNIAAHYTHDQKENPVARPYGSRQSEISDAGHAIVQLLTYVAVREIDLQEAVNTALGNLREKDFVKREAGSNEGNTITGQIGCDGMVQGRAFVDPNMSRPDTIMRLQGDIPNICRERILVTNHPYADGRLKRFAGIVTDNGGTMCHAAIVARENGIPCIVGTGNATERIKDGDRILIDATGPVGEVKIL